MLLINYLKFNIYAMQLVQSIDESFTLTFFIVIINLKQQLIITRCYLQVNSTKKKVFFFF